LLLPLDEWNLLWIILKLSFMFRLLLFLLMLLLNLLARAFKCLPGLLAVRQWAGWLDR
jgi:hypothetical protein